MIIFNETAALFLTGKVSCTSQLNTWFELREIILLICTMATVFYFLVTKSYWQTMAKGFFLHYTPPMLAGKVTGSTQNGTTTLFLLGS